MAGKPPNQKMGAKERWGDVDMSPEFDKASQAIASGANPNITVFEARFEPITTLTLSRKLPIRVHNTHGRTDEEASRAALEDLIALGIIPDQSDKPKEDQ